MAGSQANTGQWFEPETPYATVKGAAIPPRDNESKSTVYPFNKVTETESGHIVEFDDTPGSERIQIFHRSGTFDEIHPNGDKVEKIVRDQYVSVLRDSNVHIDGFSNVTVDKGLKVYVNRDNLANSETSCVNFDVHVGQNANVNLFMDKGNCNVRLNDGDINVEMMKEDVNFRQNKGNFNHFINGDYNLECTGHMHTVVGQDKVTEIGGSRDTRIDGAFDNLQVTAGYKETQVKGDHRLEVMGGVYDIFHKTHETKILLNRIIEIVGSNDEVIGTTDTLNVGAAQNQTIGGSRSVTTGGSVSVLTGGSTRETTGGTLDILAGGNASISSSSMNLNGGSSILGTAATIHLNGPVAKPATAASSASPSNKRPIYVPGPSGSWRKSESTHPRSPLSQLQNATIDLNQQLQAVNALSELNFGVTQQISSLSSNVSSLNQTLAGPVDSLGGAVKQNISGSLSLAQGAAQGVSDVATGASSVATSAAATATGAATAATAATSGLASGAGGGIAGAAAGATGGSLASSTSAISSGASSLGGLGSVFTGIGSVLGDIIDAIVEVGCAIGELINKLINALVKPILDTINSVFGKIAELLGQITKVIGDVLGKIAEFIGGILGAINDIIGKIIDAAGKFIGGIASAINGLLSNLFDGFKDIGCGDGILSGKPPDLGNTALPANIPGGDI